MEQEIILERKKVYDGVLRLIHAVVGLSILGLIATGWLGESFEDGAGEKTLWTIHIFAGYALAVGLVARITWGIVGPKSASLKELFHFRKWAELLRFRKPAAPSFGHDPMASLAYLAFYGAAIVMVVTGLGMAATEYGMGPLTPWLFDRVAFGEILEEPHEVMHLFIVGFVVLHVGALIIHECRARRPLAQAMISGYQYLPKPRNVLLALLAATALLGVERAWAATPQQILDGYAAEAKAADPKFSGFSAARGREFYMKDHPGQGEKSACAGCHTPDPKMAGKTKAGKVIDPLAGNPERFTDLKKVEKWFRRNCSDVYDRACTPAEKGDFITYVLSQGAK